MENYAEWTQYRPCTHISTAKLRVTLSQKHYAEEILRTYDSWDTDPVSTVLPPGKRLEKGDTYCREFGVLSQHDTT